jgi:hypothetical protein
MQPPSLEEFLEHGYRRLVDIGEDPTKYTKSLKTKYFSWDDNNWHTGNGRKIKNWKSTLTNTLQYLKAEKIEVKEEIDLTQMVLKQWK